MPYTTYASLCSGAGGLDMAVEQLWPEATLTWYAQHDPQDRHQYAARITAHHWPGVPNHGDITQIDWATLPQVDILTAGFPCQDISDAGPRTGIENGTRSGIWTNVAAAIGVLRPQLVIMENVAAILRRGGRRVVGDLAHLGYDARWTTLRASDIGAPHPRNRWFCIAFPAENSDSESGFEWCSAASRETKGGGHGPTLDDEVSHLLPDPNGIGRDGRTGGDAEADGGSEPADCGGSPAWWWGDYLPVVRRWEELTGIAAPAPTEVGPKGGRRLHAPFAEWMMGWPAGHATGVPGVPRGAQLKAVGNGVVTRQAVAALRELLG